MSVYHTLLLLAPHVFHRMLDPFVDLLPVGQSASSKIISLGQNIQFILGYSHYEGIKII